jgi:hypothetical protein
VKRALRKLALPAIAVVLTLSACSGFNDERGWGDAPVSKRDDSGAEVINFPNQFANIAHKCDGQGHRVYVVTHSKTDVPPVVIADPTCPGGPGSVKSTPTATPSPG